MVSRFEVRTPMGDIFLLDLTAILSVGPHLSQYGAVQQPPATHPKMCQRSLQETIDIPL